MSHGRSGPKTWNMRQMSSTVLIAQPEQYHDTFVLPLSPPEHAILFHCQTFLSPPLLRSRLIVVICWDSTLRPR